ncbi:MAG: hypothetical protein HKP29_03410 [Silicimonas sp.]|nr:hypothetical protein [Silicimonas sp.]NND22987.1 hypothetical protein [Silicimonas sp.]NNL72392.1 hypothetical protein [Silicimonas sp.]RZW07595.1 MAG: hypothetical protein EX266_06245 [Paracoccaceae bacterium]
MFSAKMDFTNGIEYELIERISAQARISLEDARGKLRPAEEPVEPFVDVSAYHCRGRADGTAKPFCRKYIVWAITQMKSLEAHNDCRQGTSWRHNRQL